MPVQIGAKSPSFSDPTGLLSDCHRRVEMFLGSLTAAANLPDRPLSNDEKRALATALRYFREAAPKHTTDEEESLFPRLRQVNDAELQEALQQMQRLEQDHRWAAPLHDVVDRLGEKWLATGTLDHADRATFREAVTNLDTMYREHIGLEDSTLFPLAARLLPPDEKNEIAREMAARRNIPQS